MKLFDKLFNKSLKQTSLEVNATSNSPIENRHNIFSNEKSQYSDLPRYYYINNIRYDIDNAESIKQIPLCETMFNTDIITGGIDAILRHHVNAFHSMVTTEIKDAGYPKISEFSYTPYKTESNLEKAARLKQEQEYKELQEELSSITKNDMEQFNFTEFEMDNPFCHHRTCIMTIKPSNINKINKDIKLINTIVAPVAEQLALKLYLNPESFKYDTGTSKVPDTSGTITHTHYYTYFKCVPYTASKKLSKFPLILCCGYPAQNNLYGTVNNLGEIYYLKTGDIGKARLIYSSAGPMYIVYLKSIKNILTVDKIEKHSYSGTVVIYANQ